MTRSGVFFALVLLASCCSREIAPVPPQATPRLTTTGRTPTEPDVSAASSQPAMPLARPTQYRKLTAAECRSLAIEHAPLAAELISHRDNVQPSHSPFKKRAEAAERSRLMRGYAADEIRNRSAGEALELYYKLLASEGQYDLLTNAHDIVRVQLTAAEKVVKGGADDRADVEKLRRQLFSLEAQLAKLGGGIIALNAGLASQLGLDPADLTPIWPADPLQVTSDAIDPEGEYAHLKDAQRIAQLQLVEAEKVQGDVEKLHRQLFGLEAQLAKLEASGLEQTVQTALRFRPDLNLIRVLMESDSSSGNLVNAVLSNANPLLGSGSSSICLTAILAAILGHPTRGESEQRQQLAGVLAARERQASTEVRVAVATLRGTRAAVLAKVAEVKNLTAKVADLEKRAAAGVAGAEVEFNIARLDRLKLLSELIQTTADWYLADVKLRQATGMLVRE